MKAILLLLVASVLLGCGSAAKIKRFTSPTYVYADRANPAVYQHLSGGGVGDSVGYLEMNRGDSTLAFGTRDNMFWSGTYHFIALKGADTVYLSKGQVYEEYDYRVDNQFPKFKLPKSQDPTAWGRATQWVLEQSDMKIQTTSENLIQTFNPLKSGQIGFTISRVPMGDEVEYNVTVVGSRIDGKSNLREEQRCAFYMITGRKY